MSSLSKAQQAFLGGIVADAACMPLHWIYEKAKALEALGDTKVRGSIPCMQLYTIPLHCTHAPLIHERPVLAHTTS